MCSTQCTRTYISILLSILLCEFFFLFLLLFLRKWQYYRLIVTLLQIDLKKKKDEEKTRSLFPLRFYVEFTQIIFAQVPLLYFPLPYDVVKRAKETFHFFYQFNLFGVCVCEFICRSVLRNNLR